MAANLDTNSSFHNVYRFTQACGTPDSFFRKTNVIVQVKGNTYVYSDITVQIRRRIGVHDYYNVDIMWEEDKDQICFRDLKLNGSYNTNHTKFKFSNGLVFGNNKLKITIMINI